MSQVSSAQSFVQLTNTHDTPRNGSHSHCCPRPFVRVPFGRSLPASHHLGALPSRLDAGSYFTSRNRSSAIITEPNACFTPRLSQQCDNSVIVHRSTQVLSDQRTEYGNFAVRSFFTHQNYIAPSSSRRIFCSCRSNVIIFFEVS